MDSNLLKNELTEDGVAFGGFMQIGHPAVAEIFARAGLRWVIIDLEHGITDLETAAGLMRAMSGGSCQALVRLPTNDPTWIARCLDAGAHGVVVPMVNTVQQAKAAVDAVKYPPAGKRGFGYGRANHYGVDFDDYAATANQNLVVIVQIEHVDGVENIDQILQVEHIDGIFVGPYDLSGSMDIVGQMDHPKMISALDQISQACTRHAMPAGLHIVQPDLARLRDALDRGFRIFALSADSVLLYAGMRDLLMRAREIIDAAG